MGNVSGNVECESVRERERGRMMITFQLGEIIVRKSATRYVASLHCYFALEPICKLASSAQLSWG